jgi:hypothetical protein
MDTHCTAALNRFLKIWLQKLPPTSFEDFVHMVYEMISALAIGIRIVLIRRIAKIRIPQFVCRTSVSCRSSITSSSTRSHPTSVTVLLHEKVPHDPTAAIRARLSRPHGFDHASMMPDRVLKFFDRSLDQFQLYLRLVTVLSQPSVPLRLLRGARVP